MVKMIKKIVDVGNSLGITLSKSWLNDCEVKRGDFVSVDIQKLKGDDRNEEKGNYND